MLTFPFAHRNCLHKTYSGC